MAIAERRAEAVWEGSLREGHGELKGGSGAFGTLPVTYASRFERSEGKTSPEELIAAAHAGCFAMAFSNLLAQEGHAPERPRSTPSARWTAPTTPCASPP